MAKNKKLRVTELDFDGIKANLKEFLSAQDQFTDYNFEGSGLSVLIDALAYNTHYLAIYQNMVANEAFIDTAQKRQSIVSIAKHLGYTPRSRIAAKAVVSVVMDVDESNSGSTPSPIITIPKGTKFSTEVDGEDYIFITNDVYTAPLDENNQYVFDNVYIYEGRLINLNFVVRENDPNQKFIIPNAHIDASTISMSVRQSTTDFTEVTFKRYENLFELDSSSEVYWLHERHDSLFEVTFGDDIVGKNVEDGNFIQMQYIVTNGESANGANAFSTTINNLDTSVTTVSSALGGGERETAESIREFAPKSFQAQNRAVTTQDYKTILENKYPDIFTIKVWGGEEDDSCAFGRVFISADPVEGISLTSAFKEDIISFLKNTYNVVSIRPEFVDANRTELELDVEVIYDEDDTTLTRNQIELLVKQSITNYSFNFINRFDYDHIDSRLCGIIDDSLDAILGNTTDIKMVHAEDITIGANARYEIKFNNAIEKGSLEVTGFTALIPATVSTK